MRTALSVPTTSRQLFVFCFFVPFKAANGCFTIQLHLASELYFRTFPQKNAGAHKLMNDNIQSVEGSGTTLIVPLMPPAVPS